MITFICWYSYDEQLFIKTFHWRKRISSTILNKYILYTACSKPNSTQTLKQIVSIDDDFVTFEMLPFFALTYKILSSFWNTNNEALCLDSAMSPKAYDFFLSMLYFRGRTLYVGLLFDMVVCDRNFEGNFFCVLLHLFPLRTAKEGPMRIQYKRLIWNLIYSQTKYVIAYKDY